MTALLQVLQYTPSACTLQFYVNYFEKVFSIICFKCWNALPGSILLAPLLVASQWGSYTNWSKVWKSPHLAAFSATDKPAGNKSWCRSTEAAPARNRPGHMFKVLKAKKVMNQRFLQGHNVKRRIPGLTPEYTYTYYRILYYIIGLKSNSLSLSAGISSLLPQGK